MEVVAKQAMYQDATRAVRLGFFVNVALGAAKLAAGWLGGSIALISDAVNSLGDAVASIVVLFAFAMAQRPPDDEHPYGHTRAEAIAGNNVALLLILSALGVAREAMHYWQAPLPPPPAWALWVAAGNVLIKETLYRYHAAVGKRTGSTAILANAWDHRSDALCSLVVVGGIGLSQWLRWTTADAFAAMFVAVVILWTGILLFRRTASELMDVQAEQSFVDAVRRSAGAVADVHDVEKLLVRKSGIEYLADIHIQVDPRLSVAEGHRIGHAVKDRLLTEFQSLRDVLVHLEPYPHDSVQEMNEAFRHAGRLHVSSPKSSIDPRNVS